MDFNKYSLYKAFIKTNQEGHDIRPVLLLEDDNVYKVFDIYNITHDDSLENKTNKNADYIYNYKMVKWKEAGLDRPSLIKIREILNIEKNMLFEKIGDLQEEDIIGLEKLIVTMYENDRKSLEKYKSESINKINIPNDIYKKFESAKEIKAKYSKLIEKDKTNNQNIKTNNINNKEKSENDGK